METRIGATYPCCYAGVHTHTHTHTHTCIQEMEFTNHFCPWMLLHMLLCLSPSPCCHPAVVPSTHYLVSCDSSSESVGSEEPRGRTDGRTDGELTTAAKLQWQRKRAKTKSLSLSGLHKKFQRRQSRTNKLCPLETTPLWKNSCGVWSSVCQADASTRPCVCAHIYAAIQLILQSFSSVSFIPSILILSVCHRRNHTVKDLFGQNMLRMRFVKLNRDQGAKLLRFCRGHSDNSD